VILSEHVEAYLKSLRPERSEVMAEMEQLAADEGIPIVHWETGRLLAVLVAALRPQRVLEVGTAIGYSTLHMAEVIGDGTIVTLERDPERIAQARAFWERAGVADRIELIEGDALQTLPALEGTFDMAFVDATKQEYGDYLGLAEPKLSARALLAIDNVLMSGEVGLGEEAETFWSKENLQSARALNESLMSSEKWLTSVLPLGDGVTLATPRTTSD
jgi:predicted O-methyltransferase YrrM